MEKLFYIDTHILDFTATIADVIPEKEKQGYWLVLDQTAFFPEAGGQSADKGTLNGLEVLDVQIKQDVIYHLIQADCNADASFLPGQVITGHVDWKQRFDFMQQHTGEHIISGLVHKHFGFQNVGFHLSLNEVTMDFDQPLSLEILRDIEKEANEIVSQNLPVHATFPSKEELAQLTYRSKIEIQDAVRIVEIPGVDICACCAPHVDTTGQIGMIKITNVQSHRGGVRLNILCGNRALSDYTEKQNTVSSLCSLLSSKPEFLADHVKRVMDETLSWKEKFNTLAQQLLQLQLDALPSPEVQNSPLLFTELENPIAIRNAVNNLCQTYSGYCGIFTGNDTSGYQFIIGSANLDCRALATDLRNTLNAKCGGSAPMIQGSVTADRQCLENFFIEQNKTI